MPDARSRPRLWPGSANRLTDDLGPKPAGHVCGGEQLHHCGRPFDCIEHQPGAFKDRWDGGGQGGQSIGPVHASPDQDSRLVCLLDVRDRM
jgi:hypothetical protein